MCGLLPPTRFSTLVFAKAASYVCEAREGGWHAFFQQRGWRADNQVKSPCAERVCRSQLSYSVATLLQFHAADAMHG